jgi:hypothetical protein
MSRPSLDGLRRSGRLTQNEFDSDLLASVRATSIHALFRSPGRRSFTYCGGNSPKRSLPVLTMSATRVRHMLCASKAMPIEEANQTLTYQVIFIITADRCCLDKAGIVASIPIRWLMRAHSTTPRSLEGAESHDH